jgi:hypothetical protein
MRKELAGLFLLLLSTPVRAERWIAASAHAPHGRSSSRTCGLKHLATETVTAQAVFFPSGGGAGDFSRARSRRDSSSRSTTRVSLLRVTGNVGPHPCSRRRASGLLRTLNTSDLCSGVVRRRAPGHAGAASATRSWRDSRAAPTGRAARARTSSSRIRAPPRPRSRSRFAGATARFSARRRFHRYRRAARSRPRSSSSRAPAARRP